jgi:hypothetical protein
MSWYRARRIALGITATAIAALRAAPAALAAPAQAPHNAALRTFLGANSQPNLWTCRRLHGITTSTGTYE